MKKKISNDFYREEMECSCGQCGYDTIDSETLEIAQWLRNKVGRPVYITSAFRCEEHNRKVGGSKHSQHLVGRALDIVVEGYDPEEIYEILDKEFGKEISLGLYSGFVHFDTRTNSGARWKG